MHKKEVRSTLKALFELGKARISLPVALSALTGYVLKTGTVGRDGLYLSLGVFLVSCSSGTINHWQERREDALMPRTRNRPIPSGKISPAFALVIAAAYLFPGSVVLIGFFPLAAFAASLVTLLAYNAFYTPLKKVTAFAVVPGSLVGALPPYVGWLAAGGGVFDPDIFLVAIFFFIGQIPHFWLLLLLFGKEYSLAGYPSLTTIFSENQIKRLSYTWILSTIASALLIATKVMTLTVVVLFLLIYVLCLLIDTIRQLLFKRDLPVRPAFFKLNFLYLL